MAPNFYFCKHAKKEEPALPRLYAPSNSRTTNHFFKGLLGPVALKLSLRVIAATEKSIFPKLAPKL